jgi:hypothetical protein
MRTKEGFAPFGKFHSLQVSRFDPFGLETIRSDRATITISSLDDRAYPNRVPETVQTRKLFPTDLTLALDHF